MFLQKYHSYYQASLFSQLNSSKNKYTKYIDNDKYTPQTIGDDTYMLDYILEYDVKDRERIIFIGDKQESIVINILDDKPELAVLKSYKKFTLEDTDYNSDSNKSSIKFLNTVLNYLKTVLNVKRVELWDTAAIFMDKNHISLNIIYFFIHQTNYYIKNWGFQFVDDFLQDKLIESVEKLKKRKCDKTDITEYFSADHFDKESVNDFLLYFYDNELVTDFIKRYKLDVNNASIFFDFIQHINYGFWFLNGQLLYLDL